MVSDDSWIKQIFPQCLYFPLRNKFGTKEPRDKYDVLIKQLIQKAINLASERNGTFSILDYGAGGMPHKEILKGAGLTYWSSEISIPFSAVNQKYDFIIENSGIPQAPAESFNGILSTSVLEHVPHPQLVINEFHRLLSNDGLLFLSTNFNYKEHGGPHDYFRFTRYGITQLLKDGQFEILDVSISGGRLEQIHHDLLKNRERNLGTLQENLVVAFKRKTWSHFARLSIKAIVAILANWLFVLFILNPLRRLDSLFISTEHYSGISVIAIKR